jgi:hypothetical protein
VQGLQIEGSDLDLVLLDGTDRWRVMNRKRNADELEVAVRRLCRAQWEGFPIRISVIRKIYKARVPLATLRVTLPASNHQIQVDMCFGDSSRGLCDEFVYKLVSQTQELEDFCLAIKIWATKRQLTETKSGGASCFAFVLLAIFFYRQSGMNFSAFFDFVHSLRTKAASLSVSIEEQRLVSRPTDGAHDFLHVAVPCRPSENAARCLRPCVWNAKLAPELRRSSALCKSLSPEKKKDINYVISQLLGGASPSSQFDHTESESEGAIETTSAEETARRKPVITIHECDDCDYFSFKESELANHTKTVHSTKRWKKRKFHR